MSIFYVKNNYTSQAGGDNPLKRAQPHIFNSFSAEKAAAHHFFL